MPAPEIAPQPSALRPHGPAQPILAATLVDRQARPAARKARSGIQSLDDVLKGGLAFGAGRGAVAAINGGLADARTLAFAFVTTHLVANSRAHVAIIDTTGTFDVLQLYQTILANLQKLARPAKPSETSSAGCRHSAPSSRLGLGARASAGDANMEERAEKILERVEIMRAFDLVGVIEAVGEVKAGLEKPLAKPSPDQDASSPVQSEEDGPASRSSRGREGAKWRRDLEVPDSEEEEATTDSDEDEMLLEPCRGAPPHAYQEKDAPDENQEEPSGSVEMIVVDNLTHVVSPLIKSNYVQAHNLLTTFLRSLSHLTSTHPLLTLLVNSSISPYMAHPNQSGDSAGPAPFTAPRGRPADHPSLFSSVTSTPALGNTIPYYVDLSLLVSRLPWSKADARRYYGAQGSGGALGRPDVITGFLGNEREVRERERGVKMGVVVEVLHDRWEGRLGGWAIFEEGRP